MKEIMDKRDLATELGIPLKRIENIINRQQFDKLPPLMPRQSGEKWYWAGRVVERWLEAQVELSSHIPAPTPPAQEEKRGRPLPFAEMGDTTQESFRWLSKS